jgi:hypothetical protein
MIGERIKGKHLETSNPPMMAMPRGRRSSEPGSAAIANGTAPRRVAKVVIRMGRKRSRAASSTARSTARACVRCCSSAKSTSSDAVLLDDADPPARRGPTRRACDRTSRAWAEQDRLQQMPQQNVRRARWRRRGGRHAQARTGWVRARSIARPICAAPDERRRCGLSGGSRGLAGLAAAGMGRGRAHEFGAPDIAAQFLAHRQRPAGIAWAEEPCSLELPILDRSGFGLAHLMPPAKEGDVGRAAGADAILAQRSKPMRLLEILVLAATPLLGARGGEGEPCHWPVSPITTRCASI